MTGNGSEISEKRLVKLIKLVVSTSFLRKNYFKATHWYGDWLLDKSRRKRINWGDGTFVYIDQRNRGVKPAVFRESIQMVLFIFVGSYRDTNIYEVRIFRSLFVHEEAYYVGGLRDIATADHTALYSYEYSRFFKGFMRVYLIRFDGYLFDIVVTGFDYVNPLSFVKPLVSNFGAIPFMLVTSAFSGFP